ncbi:DUF6332 family protein [Wenjunlia tyrosinilytica]|uniref:Uncharacterized protein n=1 Tax=Wenjunlia tyrosinilytica TaxID=1544741 RepID=A0A917ZWT0_9ACTN|nr:DUF6332 family protein [Wenjunlia tyrosinilytica]GGO95931.1 hypothetical protein GCM10012280_54270 [Wenjunlia tyrosinilytica]
MPTRTQTERDRITIEIGYALFTAGLIGLGIFVIAASPVVFWGLRGPDAVTDVRMGLGLGTAAALVRVVSVLRRW